MYQYYVFIVTKTAEGEYAHDVRWAFDEDSKQARQKAESLYYSILSQAAVSNYAQHSVTLLNDLGVPIMNQSYRR